MILKSAGDKIPSEVLKRWHNYLQSLQEPLPNSIHLFVSPKSWDVQLLFGSTQLYTSIIDIKVNLSLKTHTYIIPGKLVADSIVIYFKFMQMHFKSMQCCTCFLTSNLFCIIKAKIYYIGSSEGKGRPMSSVHICSEI